MSTLFSIITPTYNCIEKIKLTLDSVISQSFVELEYLIIDGLSNDGTGEFISKIKDQRVRILSEPDMGIYDAMNKGVRMARGKYLLFLGAGDCLCPDVLQEIEKRTISTNAGLIYGSVYWSDQIYDGEFSTDKLTFLNICHQAIFYSRDVFTLVGYYNLKYTLLADWDMNIRCFGNGQIKIVYVPVIIAVYEVGGISRNPDLPFQRDKNRLIFRHLGYKVYFRTRIRNLKHRLFLWKYKFCR